MASRDSFLARNAARWHIARANSARDRHNWLKARSHYSRALELTPGRAEIWVQLGHAAKESGALEKAAEAYARAIAIAPHVADTHLQIGHLRKRQGDMDGAAESYVKAFRIDPDLSHAEAELLALGRTPPKTDAERITDLEADAAVALDRLTTLTERVEILAERASVAAEFAFELSSTRSILGKAFERLAAVENDLAGLKDETRALVIAATKEPAPEPASRGGIEAEASNLNSSEENEIAAYS